MGVGGGGVLGQSSLGSAICDTPIDSSITSLPCLSRRPPKSLEKFVDLLLLDSSYLPHFYELGQRISSLFPKSFFLSINTSPLVSFFNSKILEILSFQSN